LQDQHVKTKSTNKVSSKRDVTVPSRHAVSATRPATCPAQWRLTPHARYRRQTTVWKTILTH